MVHLIYKGRYTHLTLCQGSAAAFEAQGDTVICHSDRPKVDQLLAGNDLCPACREDYQKLASRLSPVERVLNVSPSHKNYAYGLQRLSCNELTEVLAAEKRKGGIAKIHKEMRSRRRVASTEKTLREAQA